MKYILHDTSSMDDEKLTEIYMRFSYEGTGLFWAILERVGKQEKPIKTEVLKKQLRVGKKLEKCWAFMESIGVISSNNGETFNENILKFSEKYQIKSEKNKERVSQWRENQKDIKNVTHYEHVRNTPKVKERKVKESKESKEEGSISPDLLKSNLFRLPIIPTKEQVWELFYSNGGTKQMSESFFSKHEGTGWFLNGSPIINWRAVALRFIGNWIKNDELKPVKEYQSSAPPLRQAN